jgi:hypothetical protein
MKQYNRLRKKQKEAVLSWIAEGLETDEINERATKFRPAFEVTRAQVDYYRSTRDADLKAIRAASETQALTSGFALKEARVQALQVLANLMYRDLTSGFLWLDQAKALGSGPDSQIMDYEDFNTAEMQQLRGVFDDIAKELGHRKTVVELGWREVAKQRGYDPDQLYQDMVNAARARILAGASGSGSVGDGAGGDSAISGSAMDATTRAADAGVRE